MQNIVPVPLTVPESFTCIKELLSANPNVPLTVKLLVAETYKKGGIVNIAPASIRRL